MSLDRLFAPRSIAVYGASASDPSKLGNALLANAASSWGEVIAVHPSATGIDGIEAVGRLDRAVDLALVSVPAHRAEAAVADAATAGVGCAVVLSSGFAEAGPEGRRGQDRLAALARRRGMRLVGPNCMGVVSHLGGGRWLNGSYFWAVPERPGGLSFISQSGAFGAMFFAYLRETGLGLSRFLSVGNSVDVSVTDTLEWLGKDDLTTAIGMFVEGIDDGRRFVDVARRVTARKPVVMLKAGKMAAGARAALSHTGSMAGSHEALQAGLRRAKVTEAVDTDDLFDRLDIISAGAGLRAVRSIGVVTISGGPGVLAADAAERLGLRLPHLLDGSVKALAPLVPPFASLGNPIDLTPQCSPDHMVPAVEAVFRDPNIEGVVAINCGLDVPGFGVGVARGAASTGKPTTAFVLDVPLVEAELASAGVPRFRTPERAVAALADGGSR